MKFLYNYICLISDMCNVGKQDVSRNNVYNNLNSNLYIYIYIYIYIYMYI